jgi:polyhydroxybutyrate depolymerase
MVVEVFDGSGGNGKNYHTKMVVAPDGLPAMPRMQAKIRFNQRLWNSGQINADSQRAGISGVAFVNALLDNVAQRTSVDKNRIYATGHSNGAGMTFKIGAELSSRFFGIATVVGMNTTEGAHPTKALSALMLIRMRCPLNPI